jgi:predicted GNAT family acetyltransferase
MSDIERLKVKVGVPKSSNKISGTEFRLPRNKKIRLADVIDWLKGRGYPEDMERELIEKVKTMPDGTYMQFAKNLKGYIAAIQKRKAEEGQDHKDPASSDSP